MNPVIKEIVARCFGSKRGLTFSINGNAGSFCAMPSCYTGVQQWNCGAIEMQGQWSGGSQRLADAVQTLMPNHSLVL